MNSTPDKANLLRSQTQDVIVVVGEGDAEQEFECYKLVLAFASPYLDVMLSSDMIEANSNRIKFPHRDPEEWKLFYQFIDPNQIRTAMQDASINRETATTLVSWFHEFQMEAYLLKCDNVLVGDAKTLSKMKWPGPKPDDSFWDKESDDKQFRLNQRKANFSQLVGLLVLACTYDLHKTKANAESTIEYLLKESNRGMTHDLFEPHVTQSLVDLLLPLEEGVGDDGVKCYGPRGNSTMFWYCLPEDFRKTELSFLSRDAINKNDVLALLIYNHLKYEAVTRKHAESQKVIKRLQG